MSKSNDSHKAVYLFPHQNSIVKNVTLSYLTPTKVNQLIKPDFSPIIDQENKYGLKTKGIYKRRSNLELESPIKTPNTNYFTPIKIEGKDLFGIKEDNQYMRKLIFDENECKELNLNSGVPDQEMNDFLKKFNMNEPDYVSNNNGTSTVNFKKKIIKECENRLEKEFDIIKTIKKPEKCEKFDAVYLVQEKKTKKQYCIKKSSKKSNKNNFNNIIKLFDDMQNGNNNNELGARFCMKYLDYWVENENFELIKEDINYLNKNLFLLLEYYPNGNISDYLEKLENNKYEFALDFYWDIIFEMIMGLLFFHNKGYIHFDIKPTNFIVDNDGFIKLNDFGLSHKVEELSTLEWINEGDSRYISKELFDNCDNISESNIDNRCDVFSLGLTILDIMTKIELKSKGALWQNIRKEDFIMPDEFLKGWNIQDNKEFVELIYEMISPINKRPTLNELIKKHSQLSKRYELLMKNKYHKFSQTH